MKHYRLIIGIVWLLTACIDDQNCGCMEKGEVRFDMEDVAYVFEGEDVTDLQPYNRVTDLLNIFAFRREQLDTVAEYGYAYCQEHRIIPLTVRPGSYDFLLVANLFDRKVMSWEYADGELTAWFRIAGHQEPPLYLAAIQPATVYGQTDKSVQLQMLVSGLEMQIINPPKWIEGFDFRVRHIAGQVSNRLELRDTAVIDKSITITPETSRVIRMGISTFPTYPDIPAIVDIRLKGRSQINQLVVNDERIVFRPGRIVRLAVEFEGESAVKISVEIHNKWEVIDEGNIEI